MFPNQGGYQSGYPGSAPPGGYGGQQGGYGGAPQGGYGGHPGMGGHPSMGGHPGMGGGHPNMGGYPAPGGQYGNPEVQQWFNAVDKDRSGKINAKELQSALINGQGKNFSDTACNLMIGMFDHDKNGTIDINEFQKLYTYINQWLSVFRTYDRDQSGHIEEAELTQALSQMGFRFSPDFIKFLIAKSDTQTHRQMSVDQFIVVCVQIQKFTEAFRSRDREMKGVITIGFEDFLSVALSCSI